MIQPHDRRQFLKTGLFGLGAALLGPQPFLNLAYGAPLTGDEPILVVVQLSGGNDGLSMVVPHGDDAYYRARQQTAIGRKEVVKLDGHVGLHPFLAPLKPLYDGGKLAIVQGVSYPNPNRSHFKSMDIWQAANLDGDRVGTGWIGRAVDRIHPDETSPNLMVSVGRSVPLALAGEKHKPVAFAPGGRAYEGVADAPAPMCEPCPECAGRAAADAKAQEEFLRQVAADAKVSSKKMVEAAARYKPRGTYPGGPLAAQLRLVAALIAGKLDSRVFYVQQGGYDTHTTQRNRHDNNMKQLGEALAAFHADLDAQGLARRVTVLTFSEFGRRVKENASGGTDHGVAGPMFLLGNRVQGGLHGKHPSLTDLDNGDLKMTTDFRSVYASVIEDWLGAKDAAPVLGGKFPKLPLIGKEVF
jgi:uncharacterized protein (DUF1501 family)